MKKLFLFSMILLASCARLLAAPTPTASPPTHTPAPPSATPPLVTITASPAVATATRAVPPTPISVATPTPSPAVDFNINAADGAKLAVTYYPPIVRPAPAALLLHMLGRGKGDWEAFAKNLQKQGWAVMAMDLRGHGASTGPVDWTKAPGDVQAVFNALAARPEVDDETPRLALVGSSIGSNLALLAGAADPRVKAVVALSPGLDYMGLKPGDSIDKFGDRPVLLVASEDDAYSADTVKQLAPKLLGGKSKLFTDAGHGNAMFSDPTLETTLMDWLNVNVRDLK